VSERIVDCLEVVNVDHQERQRGLVLVLMCVARLEPEVGLTAVGQTGQRVGEGERLSNGPGTLELNEVAIVTL